MPESSLLRTTRFAIKQRNKLLVAKQNQFLDPGSISSAQKLASFQDRFRTCEEKRCFVSSDAQQAISNRRQEISFARRAANAGPQRRTGLLQRRAEIAPRVIQSHAAGGGQCRRIKRRRATQGRRTQSPIECDALQVEKDTRALSHFRRTATVSSEAGYASAERMARMSSLVLTRMKRRTDRCWRNLGPRRANKWASAHAAHRSPTFRQTRSFLFRRTFCHRMTFFEGTVSEKPKRGTSVSRKKACFIRWGLYKFRSKTLSRVLGKDLNKHGYCVAAITACADVWRHFTIQFGDFLRTVQTCGRVYLQAGHHARKVCKNLSRGSRSQGDHRREDQ